MHLSACCECIALLWRCFDQVYESQVYAPVLHINHLGDADVREAYSRRTASLDAERGA